MLAYHNDPAIKLKYLARVHAHRAADALIQGTGWEDGKGCAVGCTLEGYEHARYETELGIPVRLAYLEDRLFELLDVSTAQAWPERFLSAIRPGADLSGVWGKWAVWMLVDPQDGVVKHAKSDASISAIRRVAELWERGGTPEEFRLARADAYAYAADAAAYAAYAADAAAADAAYAAASASAAAYAAASAWRANLHDLARKACDKLVQLLEQA